ncbi:MAG: DUF4252 domain-containing protein [Bacteroidales bacterium]|nr:DUF4252 domain-containing protein [Bacteroidales bacterium]
MKRFLVTLFVLLSVTAVCQARRTPGKSDIQAMVNDMRAEARLAGISSDKESVSLPGIKVVSDANVEMVSIGGIAMKLGKSISGLNREMPAVRGISSMLVVSYEDCPVHIKDKFNAKMSNALRGCELLMEAKDNGEKMSIYGNTARDGERVNDIIMFVPQEGALICFFGSIDSKDLADLVESTTK